LASKSPMRREKLKLSHKLYFIMRCTCSSISGRLLQRLQDFDGIPVARKESTHMRHGPLGSRVH